MVSPPGLKGASLSSITFPAPWRGDDEGRRGVGEGVLYDGHDHQAGPGIWGNGTSHMVRPPPKATAKISMPSGRSPPGKMVWVDTFQNRRTSFRYMVQTPIQLDAADAAGGINPVLRGCRYGRLRLGYV